VVWEVLLLAMDESIDILALKLLGLCLQDHER
jgi:hypothetical protein